MGESKVMNRSGEGPINLRIGSEELVIRQRYEVLSIANDILIAAWFIVGSIMFFSPSSTELGTWMFLIGSIELMIRPVIRLSRRVHLKHVQERPETGTSGQEF